ncbi:glutathione peroxidase [Tepidimonas aquatica]|uniref:Glutathione peroxidase n=1 Tax=Tepidimonas aquatica TaxID=247482 RepID=A0A554WQG1_9BURK|nr:Hydroperoxy fatty acid reductase gpx1 [Tepidimonas aquatica]
MMLRWIDLHPGRAAARALAAPVAALLTMSTPAHATPCPSILQHTFARLQDEQPQNLCQYAGKVVLVVNTASYCGFTRQYEGLEALYRRYRDRGLVVLGFPSNDFGQQEPGSNQQIAEFCANTFGVQFPMFAKSSVRRPEANPLFKQLAERTGTTPKWNFYKYLISRDGRTVLAYNSLTGPESKTLLRDLERLLADGAQAAR